MKIHQVDLSQLRVALSDRCQFISFAWLRGVDEAGTITGQEDIELFVYSDGTLAMNGVIQQTLEEIIPILPPAFSGLVLLNRMDPIRKFEATRNYPFFIREDQKDNCFQFLKKVDLDYRVACAHCRRKGIRPGALLSFFGDKQTPWSNPPAPVKIPWRSWDHSKS